MRGNDAKIEDILSIGDKVSAKVIKLDPDHKKVSLSIKEFLAHGGHAGQDAEEETSSNRD